MINQGKSEILSQGLCKKSLPQIWILVCMSEVRAMTSVKEHQHILRYE